MDTFSLLKFWRNAGADPTTGCGFSESDIISSDIRSEALEADDETDDEDSYFDLMFTSPDCDDKEADNSGAVDIDSFDNAEDLCHISSKKGGETKYNFVQSPNGFFFKRRILPIEPNSRPLSPISFLKSAPKFRVFTLGFKKSKLDKTETDGASSMAATPKHNQQSKRFTVKCKVEEVPVFPSFTRDNSLRSKLQKENSGDSSPDNSSKRFPKYLKLIKPLYVRVSKRYSEKMRIPDQPAPVTPLSSPATAPVCSPRKRVDEKQGSRAAGFRVVCKQLGKSRSASSAVGIVPSPPSRRDDSMLQQQDGIQSAILHCKRSYNSSSQEFPVLSINPPRNSTEEKRSSI